MSSACVSKTTAPSYNFPEANIIEKHFLACQSLNNYLKYDPSITEEMIQKVAQYAVKYFSGKQNFCDDAIGIGSDIIANQALMGSSESWDFKFFIGFSKEVKTALISCAQANATRRWQHALG